MLIPVPAATTLRRECTKLLGDVTSEDVPAHITILYPFLPIERLTPDVITALAEIISTQSVLTVRMTAFERFPRLLYLNPEPNEWVNRLIAGVAARWPETPPYEGAYDPIPHITLAAGVDEASMATLERRLSGHLPLTATLDEAWLVIHDGVDWRRHVRFPFTPHACESGPTSTGSRLSPAEA